ncbi:lipid II flippase MurJ [Actinoplanes sp. CA-030573]|uniref:lipid II flippase MurJ n=1 Tax=Actinoplanes sp. CA-030573 TaxID=3239898 RepID=UPI003D9431FC
MTRIFVKLVLGGITGKILGIVREVLLAALFGAGKVVAAQRIALTGTMVPINFFTADALSAGFLPMYVQYRQDRPAMAAVLYRNVRNILVGFSVVLVLALVLGRNYWVAVLGPGLDGETASMAASMLVIAGLGMPFYIQYNMYVLVGLAHDDTRMFNIRPSFQSIGLIAATLVAYFSGHASVLAWGFTGPYVLLCALGTFWTHQRRYLHVPVVDGTGIHLSYRVARRTALTLFWKRLRPLLLIPLILQGSIAVERAVGSLLGVEVVAATEYSRFIVDSCMALLAAPLGLAGLTSFAKMAAHEVSGGLKRLVPPVLLLTIPLSLVLTINAKGIVTLAYARGQFDERAVDISSVMLVGFALGIWAQVIGYTLVKILNARGANFRVAIVNAAAFGSAILVNLLLYRFWGAFTLGAASSICGLLMFALSAHWLGVLRFSLVRLAELAPGAALAGVTGWLLAGDGIVRLVASCAAIGVLFLGYVAAVPPLRHAYLDSFLRRLRRKPDISDNDQATPAVRSNA